MGSSPREATYTFEDGLRSTDSPLRARRRSLETLSNAWLSPEDVGAIEAMPGFAKKNSTEITGAVFHSAASARFSSGTRLRLVSYRDGSNDDFIVNVNPANGAQTTIWSHATTPAITVPDVSIVTLNDLVFGANGTDAGFKYSGSAISAAGVTRPDVTNASLALNSGGEDSVIGVVSYYISLMTSTTEGALSVEIGPIDAGEGSRVDVDLSHADFSGNTYRVYRTLADGVQPFLVSSQVSGGATYTDDVPDSDLTNLPYLHGDPPLASLVSLAVFNQRIWGLTSDGILTWSDPKDPESWWNQGNGNYLPINEDDGDSGVGVINDQTGLYVFKTNHIYRVVGAENPEFVSVTEFEPVTQQGRSLGAPSLNAITQAHSSIVFYWNKGVYLLRGGVVEYISRDIEDDLAVIRGQDEADGVYLGFYPKRRHLHVSVPLSSGVVPTVEYIYDLDSGRWIGRRSVGFRGYLSTFDASGDEEFWGLAASSGFIYELDSGQTAAGSAISTEAKLPVFYGSNPASLKDLKYVRLEIAAQASGVLSIDVYADGNSTPITYSSISMVKSGHARWVLHVHTSTVGMARQYQVAIKSNADQPRWKVYSVTYGWHEARTKVV